MHLLKPFILLSMGLLFLTSSCKTIKDIQRPMEKYNDPIYEEGISTINVPVSLKIDTIQSKLNEAFPDVVYEDDSFDGDKMKVKATKTKDFQIIAEEMAFKYLIPLRLDIEYKTGLGIVRADGEIHLQMHTAYAMSWDWQLETQTEVQKYVWFKKPKIKVAGINIPVQFIADVILSKAQNQVTTEIDRIVSEQSNMKERVQAAWKALYTPTLVSEEYATWLMPLPKSIGMTKPLYNSKELQTSIVVEAQPRLFFGTTPDSVFTKVDMDSLPPFQFVEAPEEEGFALQIKTLMPFEEAERLSKQELLGETFSSGKYSVTVEDIDLYGSGNKLVVNTKLKGSYTGNIYLTGRPEYDAASDKIKLRDLQFTLDTKNFLHKSASWLLKSRLKKEIQNNVNFLLKYNLEEIKKTLQQQLDEAPLPEGIQMKGKVEDLSIGQAFLSSSGFNLRIDLTGFIEVGM